MSRFLLFYFIFDLQLSGHVHKGQIFPFNFITWIAYPIKTGLTDLVAAQKTTSP